MTNQLYKKLKFLSGFSCLMISEGFYDMAFIVMAYRISGQASTAAIAYALGYAAEIIVSFALGGFLDNYDRKKLFNYTISLKFALFLFLVIYCQLSAVTSIMIWCFAFFADLLHHISRTTNAVSLLQIFEGNDKSSMQGWTISISGLLRIVGPLLAGGIIAVWDNPNYLLIFCLVLQIISLWAFRDILPKLSTDISASSAKSLKENLLSSSLALREALSSQKWRWFFLTDALATLFIGTFTLMLFPLLRQLHGVNESQAGFFMGLGALGTIVVGLQFERILLRHQALQAAKVGLLAASLFALFLANNFGLIALGAGVIIFQSGSTLFFRSMGMYLQNEIPEEHLGSWWTASDAFGRIFGLVGVLAGGFIFDSIGSSGFALMMGISMLACSLGFILVPTRRMAVST